MLKELLETGYGVKEDLNCAEKILYGANRAYQLGFDRDDLKVAAGFGGGMAIESVCGALTASIMVLSRLYVQDRAHESDRIKDLVKELFDLYAEEMGSIICAPLKEQHRTKETGCHTVIVKAAEILDTIIARNQQDAAEEVKPGEDSAQAVPADGLPWGPSARVWEKSILSIDTISMVWLCVLTERES